MATYAYLDDDARGLRERCSLVRRFSTSFALPLDTHLTAQRETQPDTIFVVIPVVFVGTGGGGRRVHYGGHGSRTNDKQREIKTQQQHTTHTYAASSTAAVVSAVVSFSLSSSDDTPLQHHNNRQPRPQHTLIALPGVSFSKAV